MSYQVGANFETSLSLARIIQELFYPQELKLPVFEKKYKHRDYKYLGELYDALVVNADKLVGPHYDTGRMYKLHVVRIPMMSDGTIDHKKITSSEAVDSRLKKPIPITGGSFNEKSLTWLDLNPISEPFFQNQVYHTVLGHLVIDALDKLLGLKLNQGYTAGNLTFPGTEDELVRLLEEIRDQKQFLGLPLAKDAYIYPSPRKSFEGLSDSQPKQRSVVDEQQTSSKKKQLGSTRF